MGISILESRSVSVCSCVTSRVTGALRTETLFGCRTAPVIVIVKESKVTPLVGNCERECNGIAGAGPAAAAEGSGAAPACQK